MDRSPINTDLQATQDGLEPQTTDADITFSDGSDSTAPVATASQDGASISIDPQEELPSPTVSGDTATYAQISPGVDETLQATAQGFEVSEVIDSPSDAPPSIDVPLTLNGLIASLDDQGGLVLTDPEGNVVGGADPAVMYGAETDPETGVPTMQQVVPTSLVNGQDGLEFTRFGGRLNPTRQRPAPATTSSRTPPARAVLATSDAGESCRSPR